MAYSQSWQPKIQKLEERLSLYGGHGQLSIEIYLVAKLPPDVGNITIQDGLNRQRKHENFIEKYNIESTKAVDLDLSKNNSTAIYTFGIERDLVFHRHTGQRAITAISGSSGVVLKLSSAAPEEVNQNPQVFLDNLTFVEIPPDIIFILRFYGGNWHQFCSKGEGTGLLAVSVHVDELEGLDDQEVLREQVISGGSSIPLLTECISPNIEALLQAQAIL